MTKLKMDYLKILTFKEKHDAFKNYDNLFLSGKLADDKIDKYFWSLKSLLVFYCKNLRWHYKQKGIVFYLPGHTLRQAKKDNLIKDADTWLKYIEEVNACLGIKNAKEQKEAMLRIIDNYRYKIDSMFEYMYSTHNKKILEENRPIFKQICNEKLVLADNRPRYSCDELLISERSYNILIEYFKSYHQIKNVWLHGSRMYGTSTAGSDLDLILECDMSAWNKVSEELNELLIPYFVDSKNICDREGLAFIKSSACYGTKKIYDQKDFQIFWEDRKSLNKTFTVDISKLI